MRILLDENVPHPLMRFLAGHEVATVQSCGWRGVLNGELLLFAEESFDVFLLADKNMRYQQNMDGRKIAIVELPTDRWPLLLPLAASGNGETFDFQSLHCLWLSALRFGSQP